MKNGQMYSRCAATGRWILQRLHHKTVHQLTNVLIMTLFHDCFISNREAIFFYVLRDALLNHVKANMLLRHQGGAE